MVLSGVGRVAQRAEASARRALVCAALVAGALAAAGLAHAVTPDDADRAALAVRLADASLVRVGVASGERRLGRVTVEGDGLRATRAGRPALFVSASGRRAELVRWADIQSIEVGRPRTREGALVGLAVGAVLGVGVVELASVALRDRPQRHPWLVAVPVTAAAAAIGAWMGHDAPHWQQVYPQVTAFRDGE